MINTVVSVDMIGYGSLTRMLEQNLGVGFVTQLNQQIQAFFETGCARSPVPRAQRRLHDGGRCHSLVR
jgi:hypothetical protein